MAEWDTPSVGLLPAQDLSGLGPSFARAWPVVETPCFSDLLLAIDDGDRELWREPNSNAECIRKSLNIHRDWLR